MTCESTVGRLVQGSDTMPLSEARREPHEVVLDRMDAIVLTDVESGQDIILRAHNLVKVCVRRGGNYEGYKPMFDGRAEGFDLAGKEVSVTPVEQLGGFVRKFEVSNVPGINVRVEKFGS